MSTKQQVAHNTVIQIVGKTISTIFGFIAFGMMTRYLGTEQFGWYITTITFLSFVGILIDFGLIPVTAQMMSEPRFNKQKLFQNLLGFRFTTAIIFLFIAPFIALFFPYPIAVKQAIFFTTFSFFGVAMNQILIGYYQTKLNMKVHAIAENVGRIVLVIGLWILITQQAGFLPIMAMTVIANLAFTAYLWGAAGRETSVKLRFDLSIWKAIIIKMWPIAIAIVFNVMYLKGDVLFLTFFENQTNVGLYGAAYRVIDILTQLAMMIMGIMLPLLTYSWSRGEKKDFHERLELGFNTMMLFALPVTAGVMIKATPIITLIAGADFAYAGNILTILAIAVFGVYLGAVFGHTAVAINKQKQVLWVYLSNAIITLIGYFLFIPRYGLAGAAWMTVFSELYTSTMLYAMIHHYTKQHIRMFTFFKMIFSTGIMSLILLQFPNIPLILSIFLGALIYSIMLFITKTVTKESIQEIIQLKKST